MTGPEFNKQEAAERERIRLRHDYLARTKDERAAKDEEHGVPAMEKVRKALRPDGVRG